MLFHLILINLARRIARSLTSKAQFFEVLIDLVLRACIRRGEYRIMYVF